MNNDEMAALYDTELNLYAVGDHLILGLVAIVVPPSL
jgi:hypothetical protein